MRVAPEELHSGCISPDSRRLGHSRYLSVPVILPGYR